MQNFCKANYFKTNAGLDNLEGGSQEKSWCQKGKIKIWTGMAVPESYGM